MSARVLPQLLAAAVLLACGGKTPQELPPTGQIVLYVTTDAPLPPAPGELVDPAEPPALFDSLRLELFAPGASAPCAMCTRDFSIDRAKVRNNELSIGFAPPPGSSGYVARARLFRFVTERGGEPPTLSTIDVYAALPVVSSEGVVDATIVLRVEDVGHPLGSLAAPTQTREGKPEYAQVGLWPRAVRVPCSGSAHSDEACVPGGAFWMGNPSAGVSNRDGSDQSDSRLVVVSPFYVDLHEVTVADFRASGLATLNGGSSVDPLIGAPELPPAAGTDGALTPESPQFFCNYSDAPFSSANSRESQALNCISWTVASQYCAAQGKTLPSEAQFEYMASGLRSSLFLWGDDAPEQCGDSVCLRGGLGYFAGPWDKCRAPGDVGGPLSPGNGSLDRLMLGQGEVLDLMGNVSEWTRDFWNRTNEPCWAGRSLLEDPECTTVSAGDGDSRTTKGFPWSSNPQPSAFRVSNPPASTLPQTGFRCVRGVK